MAIKVQGITVIDDGRNIINGIGASFTGIITANTFVGSGASLTNISNTALTNSSVNYGGVTVSLGGTDATPAFNLSDAINYPYTSLTGITTEIVGDITPQLGGNLDINSKFITGTGGINVTGVVTATSFSGSGANLTSIPNGALTNSSIAIGGVTLNLGDTDATPAFNLSDATSYPYTSLTGITTEIIGDATPQLGGNLDINSKFITGTGGINVTGVVTATSFSGSGANLTGLTGASAATYGDAFTVPQIAVNSDGKITGISNVTISGGGGGGGGISGVTIKEEGFVVGTSNSIRDINFVSDNLTASGSGVGATITFTSTPTFTSAVVGSGVTINSSGINAIGVVTATTFSGSGANLTSIPNGALTNSSIAIGGVTLNLGDTDATPAFDLSDATAYPTSSLSGTITNAQLAGSIANAKLANSSIAIGGLTLNLGDTDTTPAFDLSDATAYPTSSLVGTITNAQLAGSIVNAKLVNDSVSFGGVSLDLGETDATPAFNLSDATAYPYASLTGITTSIVGDTTPQLGGNLDINGKFITGTGGINVSGVITATTFSGNLPTTDLTGTITNAQLAGSIENAKLSNSSIAIGGVTLNLGDTDATPAFNLSDATAYPTSSLVGTITNAQLAGSIANTKLANSSIVIGGVTLNLGDTDATPAFNLSDATAYPTSSLSGTITNAQLAGSIANANLVNSSIAIGGVTLNLGDTDATPAFNLSDATAYPYTSLTGITTSIVGDTTPQLGGNLDINGKFITGTGGINVSGVVTATTFDGNVTGNVTGGVSGNAGTATSLSSARNFSISGDVVASAVSFDGTGDVVLSTAIQPNSVALATDTTGDFVQSITGTTNEVTVSVTSGENSTPQIGLPNDVTIGQDLTVTRNIDVDGHTELDDVNVSGIITASSLNVTNKLITTGIGISIANGAGNTAYIEGPSEIWIDPHPFGVGQTSGSVRIRGDLYVDGTEFIVNVDKIQLGDFKIGIATTAGTNALLDGGGLGIGSESIEKTITWNNATSALMSSENWNLASGKHYEINGTDVLTSNTLGSGIINSSLTSVGTLGALTVSGNVNANGNIVGDSATNISGINSVTATSFYGSGANLTSIPNGALTNSSVNYGGVTLALGGSDTTPAFDLSDATAYPTSSLVGTITNAQLAGSIVNAKLSNSSIAIGGVTLNLGDTDATPAFNLSDATAYPTSSLVGTITNTQLAGSIADGKLSSTFLKNVVEDTTPQLGGNLDLNGKFITGTGGLNVTGVVTASSLDAAISEWILGADGSSNYTFTGPGFIGAENDPSIYLVRGQKYRFVNNSGGFHPFQIRNSNGGSAYSDGVTNNGAASGNIDWNVQFDAPNELYYQCTSHSSMGGKIYIGNSGESIIVGAAVTINSSGINVTGVVTATTFSGDLPTTDLTGTITNAQLAGSIVNAKLSNSSIAIGGVTLNLGDTDATPAFDLSDATAYPTSSLSGTITNAQLAGSIANAKLVNSTMTVGGVTLTLGATDATPAFNLSDATAYPTSSLSGTITNAQLAGSIADGKLSSTFLKNVVEDTTPQLGGNLDFNSKFITGTGGINVTGVVTATTFDGNLTGTASNASGATGDFSIADKIIHTGDTNTALRFPAADTFTVETAGTERLRINSTGATSVTGSLAVNGNNYPTAGALSNRNLIMNGSMQVAQRGTSLAQTTTPAFLVDRFKVYDSPSNTHTLTQSQSSNVPNYTTTGFSKSLRVEVTSGAATPVDGYTIIAQAIEGFDSAQLQFGTANAKTVTLSFWARTNASGNYSVALRNSAANYNYIAQFGHMGSNLWFPIKITIPGATAGTWLTDNGRGVEVLWNLDAGSNYYGTEDAWNSAIVFNLAADTNTFSNTTGNYFELTGVQLEVGSKSTPFVHESYGQTLAKCQRYFEGVPAGSTFNQGDAICWAGYTFLNGSNYATKAFTVEKRAIPTIVMTDNTVVAGFNLATCAVQVAGTRGIRGSAQATATAGARYFFLHFTADADI